MKKAYLKKVALAAALLSASGLYAYSAESLPYTCGFETQEALATWQAIDVDGDGLNWTLDQPDYGPDMACSTAAYLNFGTTDNRLISPAISLPAGQDLSIKFKYYTAYYVTEILDVYISPAPLTGEPTDNDTLVTTLELRDYYGKDQQIIVPALETAGDYYITLRHRASEENSYGFVLYICDFTIGQMSDGNLSGVVSGVAGPLAGADVSIKGAVQKSTVTDAEGRYTFEAIPSGSYSVDFSAFGYSSTTKTFDVTADQTADGSVTLYEMSKAKVSGVVTDKDGTPLEGASVMLEGYTTFRTMSGSDGKYQIDGVYLYDYYAGSPYTLTINRNNFVQPEPKRISMYSDYDAGTSRLDYDILPPHSVGCEMQGDSPVVTWERPVTTTRLKFDNGTPETPLGYDQGLYQNILGTIYREPMNVSDLEWYTFDNYGDNRQVTLYLISLDDLGEPTGEIIYSAKDIPNTPDTWSSWHIENPVECPNGFLLAISGVGNVCIAKDNSTTLTPRTQLYSNTYVTPDAYRYFEDVNWTGALCLRAAGEKIQPEIPLKIKYDVYRVDADDTSVRTALLTGTTEKTVTDSDFKNLPRGSYKYAVEVAYDIDSRVSGPAFSDAMHRLQHTNLTVNVTADSDPADAEGAKVTLSREGQEPLSATVTDGKVSFKEIWKDKNYTLAVSRKGFNNYSSPLDLDDLEQYDVDAQLNQILAPVANIDIEKSDDGNTSALLYDQFADINESFEGDDFQDFEINPSGELGWQYIDGDDMPTYGFNVSTFPGSGSCMAAIILDSSKTEPELTRDVAHTGKRALGFFCPKMTIGESGIEIIHPSDDWLISPKLSYHRDFTLSFFAKTWEAQESRLENIRVGYSTTGCEPEDFTFLDSEYGVDVPLEYTEFTYSIPKEAAYVAVNSRSDDVFLLCMDDIRLTTGALHSGEAPSQGHFRHYEISIDGEAQAQTSDTKYPLPSLEEGAHTAEVTKVYNGGKSRPMSIEFTVGQAGIAYTMADGQFGILYNGSTVRTSAQASSISIFTPDGKLAADAADTDRIDVRSLANGIYIVRAVSPDGQQATSRIMVR